MKIIHTPAMPPANGHYSQCVEHHGILYISGQLPVDPVTKKIPDTIEAQTDLTLGKIGLILQEAGSDRSKVLQVRIYIADIELWGKVNERYSIFFGTHRPARCIIPVPLLHYCSLIEIEVTAFKD